MLNQYLGKLIKWKGLTRKNFIESPNSMRNPDKTIAKPPDYTVRPNDWKKLKKNIFWFLKDVQIEIDLFNSPNIFKLCCL